MQQEHVMLRTGVSLKRTNGSVARTPRPPKSALGDTIDVGATTGILCTIVGAVANTVSMRAGVGSRLSRGDCTGEA